jgi:hypothetical protein
MKQSADHLLDQGLALVGAEPAAEVLLGDDVGRVLRWVAPMQEFSHTCPKERPMSIERIFYCDWRECDRHVQTANSRSATFVTVTEGAGRSLHFCNWDCILKHAAEKPPVDVVPMAAES